MLQPSAFAELQPLADWSRKLLMPDPLHILDVQLAAADTEGMRESATHVWGISGEPSPPARDVDESLDWVTDRFTRQADGWEGHSHDEFSSVLRSDNLEAREALAQFTEVGNAWAEGADAIEWAYTQAVGECLRASIDVAAMSTGRNEDDLDLRRAVARRIADAMQTVVDQCRRLHDEIDDIAPRVRALAYDSASGDNAGRGDDAGGGDAPRDHGPDSRRTPPGDETGRRPGGEEHGPPEGPVGGPTSGEEPPGRPSEDTAEPEVERGSHTTRPEPTRDSDTQPPDPAAGMLRPTENHTDPTRPAAGRTHLVAPGDTLWDLADRYLQDPSRWSEIYAANRAAITDPELIYPGQHLRVPTSDDSHNGAAAPPPGHPPPPSPPPAAGSDQPGGHPPGDQNPDEHAPDGDRPGDPPADTDGPTGPSPTPPPPEPPGPSEPSLPDAPQEGNRPRPPTRDPAPDGNPPTQDPPHSASPPTEAPPTARHEDDTPDTTLAGAHLPSGAWVAAGLAAAVLATSGLALLHRRRRAATTGAPPISVEEDPQLITSLQHAIGRQPDPLHGVPIPPLAQGGTGEELNLAACAAGGLCLTGPGAASAARAAMAGMVCAGGPLNPDAQGVTVLSADTFTELAGGQPPLLGSRRLVTLANDDEVLRWLRVEVLRRRRLLHQHGAETAAQLPHVDEYAEPLPLALAILTTPDPQATRAAQTILTEGADLGIVALLLGDWPTSPGVFVDGGGGLTIDACDPAPDSVAQLNGARASTMTRTDLAAALHVAAQSCPPEPEPEPELLDLPEAPAPPHASSPWPPLAPHQKPIPPQSPPPPQEQDTEPDEPEPTDPDPHDPQTQDTQDRGTPERGGDAISRDHAHQPPNDLPDRTDAPHTKQAEPIPDIRAALSGPREATHGPDTKPTSAHGPHAPEHIDPTAESDEGAARTPNSDKPLDARDVEPPAMLTVFGAPKVFAAGQELTRGLRSTARRLLLWLAVHPEGGTASQIIPDLWPTHDEQATSKAKVQLRTAVHNARQELTIASGAPQASFIDLDPDRRYVLVDSDVRNEWTVFQALLTRARKAESTGNRRAAINALNAAVELCRGPLADGQDAAWLLAVRRHTLDETVAALTRLAELTADEPDQAVAHLRHAISLDPYTEATYQALMRLHARNAQHEQVRHVLQQLHTQLADLNEEPTQDTIILAGQLLTDDRRR